MSYPALRPGKCRAAALKAFSFLDTACRRAIPRVGTGMPRGDEHQAWRGVLTATDPRFGVWHRRAERINLCGVFRSPLQRYAEKLQASCTTVRAPREHGLMR